jgi:hypothetical protein
MRQRICRKLLMWFAPVAALALAIPVLAQTTRIEIHPIRSMTLTDEQFLNGRKDVQPVTIADELRLPHPWADRMPAVVLRHGSGGLSVSTARWAEELTGMGIAAFLLDSFSARDLTNTSADQDQLGRLAMIIDAYRALELPVNAHLRDE